MLAHCFNPRACTRACAVFRLASTAVNQNQVHFKYRCDTAFVNFRFWGLFIQTRAIYL